MKSSILKILFFIVCLSESFPNEALANTGCKSWIARLASVATSAAICMGSIGCASPNSVLNIDNSLIDKGIASETASKIEKKFAGQKFDYVIHFEFNGNDFSGGRDGMFANLSPARIQNIARYEGIDLEFKDSNNEKYIPSKNSPFFFTEGSQKFLGTFSFRFHEKDYAIRFIDEIFKNPSQDLKKAFIIVTGDSHGGSEVDRFLGDLKRRFHITPQVLIVSDAIDQPLFFPTWFFVNRGDSIAVNTYQRDIHFDLSRPIGLLGGSSIIGFTNYKLTGDMDHISAMRSDSISQELAENLELTPTGPRWPIDFEKYETLDRTRTQYSEILRPSRLNGDPDQKKIEEFLKSDDPYKIRAAIENLVMPNSSQFEWVIQHPDFTVRSAIYSHLPALIKEDRLRYWLLAKKTLGDKLSRFERILTLSEYLVSNMSDEELIFLSELYQPKEIHELIEWSNKMGLKKMDASYILKFFRGLGPQYFENHSLDDKNNFKIFRIVCDANFYRLEVLDKITKWLGDNKDKLPKDFFSSPLWDKPAVLIELNRSFKRQSIPLEFTLSKK